MARQKVSADTGKAVSYLRVSGRGQIDRDGFPRQRDTVERHARAAGLRLIAEFRDEGVSGTKELDAREGLSDSSPVSERTVFASSSSNAPTAWP